MFNKVISILGTLILLVLAGCRDVAPISVEEPSTENRTITLNLDITTRADNLLPDNSEPDIIRLWICDMNDKIITSIVSSHNVWTPVPVGMVMDRAAFTPSMALTATVCPMLMPGPKFV